MHARYRCLALLAPLAVAACAAPGMVTSQAATSQPASDAPTPLVHVSPPPANKQPPLPKATFAPAPLATANAGPSQCGSWDLPTSSFGKSTLARSGEQVACLLVQTPTGPVLVVVTDGSAGPGAAGKGAAVGIDRCPSPAACADARTDHAADVWRWFPVPGSTGAVFRGVSPQGVLTIVTSTNEYIFDATAASPQFALVPTVASN